MADAEGKKRTFRKYSYRCACTPPDGAGGAAGAPPGAMGMVAAWRPHGWGPRAPGGRAAGPGWMAAARGPAAAGPAPCRPLCGPRARPRAASPAAAAAWTWSSCWTCPPMSWWSCSPPASAAGEWRAHEAGDGCAGCAPVTRLLQDCRPGSSRQEGVATERAGDAAGGHSVQRGCSMPAGACGYLVWRASSRRMDGSLVQHSRQSPPRGDPAARCKQHPLGSGVVH